MADERIIDLPAIITQSTTDIYETSLNGIGSRRESRAQMLAYMAQFFNTGRSSEATHNTSATLTGAEIVGGIIRSTPAAPGVVLTMPTAAAIFAAMAQTPVVGSYIDCKFENFSAIPLTLSVTDAALQTTGVVSTIVGPQQSVIYRFTVNSVSPVHIVIDGGQFAPNNNPTMVFVNGTSGVDIVGNGSYQHPYATISFAQSHISDASPNKVYTLMVSGDIVDTGQIYVSPSINIFAVSPNVKVTNSMTILADPAWTTATSGFDYSYWQNLAIYGNISLDFSTFGTSTFPFIQFIQMYFEGGLPTFNGTASTSSPGTTIYLYQCYAGFGLTVDNCYVYSADGQYFNAINLGTGTATNAVEFYSVGDIISGSFAFTDSNASSCTPIFNSYGSAINNGGLTFNSTNAISATTIAIQGANIANINFNVSGTGGGSITGLISGNNQIPVLTFNDTSTAGTNIILTLDGIAASTVVSAGTPNITYRFMPYSAAIPPTDVYVDGNTGVDAVGNGSYFKPYATISYAESQITDASQAKIYNIYITSNINDGGTLYLTPWINFIGVGGQVEVENAFSSVNVSPAWNGGFGNVYMENIEFTRPVVMDFSTVSPPVIGTPSITFVNMYFNGGGTFNGYSSGDNPDVDFYSYNSTYENSTFDNTRVFSFSNTFHGSLGIGTNTALSGNLFNSFNDLFVSTMTHFISNSTSTNVCKFNAIGSVFNNAVDSDNEGAANATASFVACRFDDQVYLNVGNVAGLLNVNINNCNKISQINYSDLSSTAKDLTLNIDSASYPAVMNITSGFYNGITSDNNTFDVTNAIVKPYFMLQGVKYIADSTGNTDFKAPVLSKLGEETSVVQGLTGPTFTITCNAGQTIHYGSQSSTTGTGGSISSTSGSGYSALTLKCIAQDSDFVVINSVGSFVVV